MTRSTDIITIDGAQGEGGGQILRSALGLSLYTGQPFRVSNIRAGRAKPGLLRQHLTAVHAAAEIGAAEVTGDAIGSRELTFKPGRVRPGKYRFAVGTAGSATLVLQAVLPGLLTAGAPTELTLEGGTHNPFAPPFDFLAKAFLPLINRMGPKITVNLERHGFYPAGGGCFHVRINPAPGLAPFTLEHRGEVRAIRVTATVSKIPGAVAGRELKAFQAELRRDDLALNTQQIDDSPGPGNVLVAEVESENVTEVFTGFGEKSVRAEAVAAQAAQEAKTYLDSGVPVGVHLADQLLIPLAMAGGGSFRTLPLTAHTRTNAEVVERFLERKVTLRPEAACCTIEIA